MTLKTIIAVLREARKIAAEKRLTKIDSDDRAEELEITCASRQGTIDGLRSFIQEIEKENDDLRAKLDDAYERAAKACESLTKANPHGLMEEDAHNGTIEDCIDAINAIKESDRT